MPCCWTSPPTTSTTTPRTSWSASCSPGADPSCWPATTAGCSTPRRRRSSTSTPAWIPRAAAAGAWAPCSAAASRPIWSSASASGRAGRRAGGSRRSSAAAGRPRRSWSTRTSSTARPPGQRRGSRRSSTPIARRAPWTDGPGPPIGASSSCSGMPSHRRRGRRCWPRCPPRRRGIPPKPSWSSTQPESAEGWTPWICWSCTASTC